ncbi:MAG TPA: oligoendopeptidase, partial [Solirubrobacteraceae bacterium]
MATEAAETAQAPADPELELEAVEWDLEPLVEGAGERGVERQLDEALQRAKAFAERYAGQVAGFDAAALREAMQELVDLQDLVARAGNYAMLGFSTATADPERGALLQKVQERGTEIETTLLFFELEWAALEPERAEELLAGDGLDFCRHYLRTQRRYRPHLLTEPEERVMSEKSVSGGAAWGRLFAELTSAIEVTLPGEEPVALDVALSRLDSPDREVRCNASEGVTAALEPGLRTRGFIFNTLLHDKAVDDRLRAFPSWIASRNLSNEASDESVQALVEAVRNRYDLPQRWYRLKAKMLGIERLADYDRAAAVTDDDVEVPWSEARDLVLSSFG